ncbi:hypothetical protein [Psychroserpens mesophilus]|uniref:hypothetical protein n=1 Tax=Psychroserpens mesophilus TaxID=325473 RepID=UPI003D65EC45
MYNQIKNICTTNEWVFTYAREDFANLYDGEEQVDDTTPLVFLYPPLITETFGDYNELESTNYTGDFLVLLSSDIDEEDYDYRYQTYIKPLINNTMITIKESIQCDNTLSIVTWRITEVLNLFDFNLDGLLITYSVNG